MYEFGDIVILWIQWVRQCVYLKDLYINTLEKRMYRVRQKERVGWRDKKTAPQRRIGEAKRKRE